MKELEKYTNSFAKFEKIASKLEFGSFDNCMMPEVSVVMPVYKRSDLFEIALKSALSQTFKGQYEIVVVDNYDLDGESPNLRVVKKISALNVFYYHNSENLGMFGNWNRCVELARSENVVFCHDDDVLEPDALEHLMRIKNSIGDECIFSTHNNIDEDGNIIFKYDYPRKKFLFKEKETFRATPLYWMLHSAGCSSGCLYNKRVMLDIGGFNEISFPSADYELLMRYTINGGCVISNKPTYNYRVASNESFNVYDKFADSDRKLHIKLKDYISIPNIILNKIVAIRYKENIINNKRAFGKDCIISEKLGLSDRLILGFFKTITEAKKYTI